MSTFRSLLKKAREPLPLVAAQNRRSEVTATHRAATKGSGILQRFFQQAPKPDRQTDSVCTPSQPPPPDSVPADSFRTQRHPGIAGDTRPCRTADSDGGP